MIDIQVHDEHVLAAVGGEAVNAPIVNRLVRRAGQQDVRPLLEYRFLVIAQQEESGFKKGSRIVSTGIKTNAGVRSTLKFQKEDEYMIKNSLLKAVPRKNENSNNLCYI